MVSFVVNFVRGALMGIAEVIPGVSGGTIEPWWTRSQTASWLFGNFLASLGTSHLFLHSGAHLNHCLGSYYCP